LYASTSTRHSGALVSTKTVTPAAPRTARISCSISAAARVHATCVAVIEPLAASSLGLAPRSVAIAVHSRSSVASSSPAVTVKLAVASRKARSFFAESVTPKSPEQFSPPGPTTPQPGATSAIEPARDRERAIDESARVRR
jgi:hypothetical protein